jgi:quercetin dioxygenase-like cupin family protein
MRLFRFDAEVSRPIHQYGSEDLRITPITRLTQGGQVAAMWIAPGGQVGAHPADGAQLFLVIQGVGWVEGADGARASIRAGQAAYWEDSERHTAGSPSGMGALVIEATALDLTLLQPLTPSEDTSPA